MRQASACGTLNTLPTHGRSTLVATRIVIVEVLATTARPVKLKAVETQRSGFRAIFASSELLKIGCSVYSHSFGEQL